MVDLVRGEREVAAREEEVEVMATGAGVVASARMEEGAKGNR